MIFEEIINNKFKIISSSEIVKKDRENLKKLLNEKYELQNHLLFVQNFCF